MPERIQLRRTKGFHIPENARSVARPTKWGNPLPVKPWGLELSLAIYADAARGIWSPNHLADADDFDYAIAYQFIYEWRQRFRCHPTEAIRSELRGLDLACWCPLDQPCHADVLLELANGAA